MGGRHAFGRWSPVRGVRASVARIGRTRARSAGGDDARPASRASVGGRGLGRLVVDDAHLFDEASAALVHQLAIGRTLRVVLTVRSGEPTPDAIVALWKDGWLECLDLQPLDRIALGELVSGLVGGQIDSLAVARVWEQPEGTRSSAVSSSAQPWPRGCCVRGGCLALARRAAGDRQDVGPDRRPPFRARREELAALESSRSPMAPTRSCSAISSTRRLGSGSCGGASSTSRPRADNRSSR